jgi:arsenate reductase
MSDTTVWFNPSCSKCRALRGILEERGVEAEYRHYLEEPPTKAELEQLAGLLGLEDPSPMLRAKDAAFTEMGLAGADAGSMLDAVVAHPALLERPVLVHRGRAVIARPPERALEILD